MNTQNESVYYINLDSCIERNNKIISDFDGALPDNFKLKRWCATRHTAGWKGCILSHSNILSYLSNNEPSDLYIVLEDDCKLLDNKETFKQRFIKYYTYLKEHIGEWDFFTAGGIYLKPIRIVCRDPFIIESNWAACSQFIIHSNKSAKNVINYGSNPTKWKKSIDTYISSQHSGKIWLPYPLLCEQYFEYKSTIGSNTNYTLKIKKEFENAHKVLDDFVKKNS
jgi:GR25 family glycosyltransferase involved in LPS biosynthesis